MSRPLNRQLHSLLLRLHLQGASSPDPTTVYVDTRALRNDRVALVERGAPHSLCLMESGKLLPGLKVVIANPDTRGQCGDSHLGKHSHSLHSLICFTLLLLTDIVVVRR